MASLAADVRIHRCQIDCLAPDSPAHSFESYRVDWARPGNEAPVARRQSVGPHDIGIPADIIRLSCLHVCWLDWY